MCRLYGFRATSPRKVECELIRAQNALLAQSRNDESGKPNADGWGLGTYSDGLPQVDRQADPAYASEGFRWAAAKVRARDVIAHIRRATVGTPRLENTHPFVHDRWIFAHNGSVGAFERVKGRMIDRMSDAHRSAIRGTTDTEHVFHYLMSELERRPSARLLDVLRDGIRQVRTWVVELDPAAETSLNVLWTNGDQLVGSRLGRSLWYVERDAVHPCEVCGGELHVDEDNPPDYHAVVIASERITVSETWHEVPDASVFAATRGRAMHIEPL